ncbi:MAG: hypothetical protein ACLTY0_11050, partial [Lachnospiraceae bacterium]
MPNLPHSEPLTFFRKRQRFIPITIFLSAFTSFFLSAFTSFFCSFLHTLFSHVEFVEYYGSNVPLFRRNGYRQS